MKRTDYYSLQVSYWPHAVEAGMKPVEAVGFPEGPQFYRSHTFNFRRPPSRDEFLAVVAQLPWAQCWLDNGLGEDIERSDWPMVDYMHKAATSSLMNSNGQVVGELRVQREERWENDGYDRAMVAVHVTEQDAVVNRFTKAKRDAAKMALLQHENRIRESFLRERPTTDRARRAIIRGVLRSLPA